MVWSQNRLDRADTAQLTSVSLPLVSFIRGLDVASLLEHQYRLARLGEVKDEDLRPGVRARVANVLVQMIARFVPYLTRFVLSRLFSFHLVHDILLKYVDELPARMTVYGGMYAWGYFHREDPSLLALQALYGLFGHFGNGSRALFAWRCHRASFLFVTVADRGTVLAWAGGWLYRAWGS